ncbi:hypothetical protein EVAR_97236_1 [Eumeta japonica]|uniref:Uncharacterized protein n=1 Tax=Eumeta variegata TaxID=151549 RepID=A0A4C2A2V7_EUMVA|nr:hypothetical protein EVAR_97236_1 [Eumeta japonica]
MSECRKVYTRKSSISAAKRQRETEEGSTSTISPPHTRARSPATQCGPLYVLPNGEAAACWVTISATCHRGANVRFVHHLIVFAIDENVGHHIRPPIAVRERDQNIHKLYNCL